MKSKKWVLDYPIANVILCRDILTDIPINPVKTGFLKADG
jgi:hypothetical protein